MWLNVAFCEPICSKLVDSVHATRNTRADPGFFSRESPTFVLKFQKYLSTFKQMLAVCVCLTNVTGSNHEEVSTNRDTWFSSTLSYIFSAGPPMETCTGFKRKRIAMYCEHPFINHHNIICKKRIQHTLKYDFQL